MSKQMNWIIVPQQDFIRASSGPAVGVQSPLVRFYRSPFDVPNRIRAEFQEPHNFTIWFEYLGTEEEVEVRVNDRVSASIGKHSGRVYRVAMDLAGITTVEELESLLFAALNSPLRKAVKHENIENYGAARGVIEKTKSKLFASIPAFV